MNIVISFCFIIVSKSEIAKISSDVEARKWMLVLNSFWFSLVSQLWQSKPFRKADLIETPWLQCSFEIMKTDVKNHVIQDCSIIAGLSNRTVFNGKANSSDKLIQFNCCDYNFLEDFSLRPCLEACMSGLSLTLKHTTTVQYNSWFAIIRTQKSDWIKFNSIISILYEVLETIFHTSSIHSVE